MSWLNGFNSQGEGANGLYTETHGQGKETVVFIPGLGGTTRYWRARLGSFENRYRVVLVDLLGFGQSPKLWMRYSVEHHVDALHEALADLGPISIVGHSLGALLTVAYAAQYPEQIRSIALLGMPYFGSQRRAYEYMRHGPVKGGYLYTNVALTMTACILTRRVLGRLLPYLLRHVPREVAEDLVKHTWRSSTSSLWEVVYRYDAAEDLKRLPAHIEVLCIHGERDAIAPVAAIEQLVAAQPQWRLRVFPGVDHHPFLRNPDGCLALVGELVSYGPDRLVRPE
jgi:pimeloyl-ACP methyl ester carboxylesterase